MFDDSIRFHAELRPDAVALIGPHLRVTFGELEAQVRRAVHALRDIGAKPGDAVSIAVKDIHLQWILCLAFARVGVATSPTGDFDAEYRIVDAGTDDVPAATGQVIRLSSDDADRIRSGPAQPYFRVLPDPASLGRVFLTSGTTGKSKRVGWGWNHLINGLRRTAIEHCGFAGPWMCTAGIGTPFGYGYALAAWMCGNPAVVEIPASARALSAIRPAFLGLICLELQGLLETLPPKFLTWRMRVLSGGVLIPPHVIRMYRERLGSDFLTNYGSTEGGVVTSGTLEFHEREPRGTGIIQPGVDLRVVDDEGRDVPRGELGRFVTRHDGLALGYLGDPERSAAAFRDGWFWSNDMGRMREDGVVFLEGRSDDFINIGGHKVLPAWVEQAAMSCQGVVEAAAFAVPGPSGLDECGVAVVANGPIAPGSLEQALARQVSFLRGIRIYRVPEIPRSVGKVDRKQLRAMAAGQQPPRA